MNIMSFFLNTFETVDVFDLDLFLTYKCVFDTIKNFNKIIRKIEVFICSQSNK